MSKPRKPLSLERPLYPERDDVLPQGWLEETSERLRGDVSRWRRSFGALRSGIVERTRHHEEAGIGVLDAAGLREAAREVGKALRRDGYEPDLVAQAFALVSRAAQLTLGFKHHDVQLQGGWVLLQGMVAEMETGEGKTLTATLPACTAALAGVPVHVITVNDYLVSRDAEEMRPIYEALGLSVGVVVEDQQPPERQAAYACRVTYASNKTLVFDYLRDRIVLGDRNSALRLRLEKLGGKSSRVGKLLLQGLSFAIVDEADSVLVDEARTPLIISAPAEGGDEALVAEQGIALARDMQRGVDFTENSAERKIALTDAGREALEARCAELGGVWAGFLRREELATQALSALHLFKIDEHYLVREDKIQIIDEYTGRVMADRTWERGLHQLIEAKEGCTVTAQKEPLARISYQRFFRRYLHLAGMSGTASEVAGEFGAVYDLPVVRVPTHRPSARTLLPEQVFPDMERKWQHIAERVAQINAEGRPVLLGTHSVAASEHASQLLTARGLAHRVLNAKQDAEEAGIVAEAGQRGCITIATNMAGRGTDIKLKPDVGALGGLHVILSERHDSKRIDRQLAGRCARQGDPGVFESILSLEDSIMAVLGPRTRRLLLALVGGLGPRARSWLVGHAQKRAETAHSRVRKGLLKQDQQVSKLLAFSGRPE